MILIFSSCLTYKTIQYTIDFTDNFDRGTITVAYADIRSSEKEKEKQIEDFDDLIRYYQDDELLLDQVNKGVYVKEIKLFEEDNKIMGYFSGIFQKLKIEDSEMKVRNGERFILLDISESEEVETNGKVYRSEKTALVVWPIDQKHLMIKKTVQDYDNISYPIIEYYHDWMKE